MNLGPIRLRGCTGTYRVPLLFLLHQDDVPSERQLSRELLILLTEPINDFLQGDLKLATVIREGLQTSP